MLVHFKLTTQMLLNKLELINIVTKSRDSFHFIPEPKIFEEHNQV